MKKTYVVEVDTSDTRDDGDRQGVEIARALHHTFGGRATVSLHQAWEYHGPTIAFDPVAHDGNL